ncbi:MAG: hypothetical protein ABIP59_13210 [Roseateles sp.]
MKKMPHAIRTAAALLLVMSSAMAAAPDSQEAQIVASVKRLTPRRWTNGWRWRPSNAVRSARRC